MRSYVAYSGELLHLFMLQYMVHMRCTVKESVPQSGLASGGLRERSEGPPQASSTGCV
jgi:hypothetical protein